jgi:hypothetical protein
MIKIFRNNLFFYGHQNKNHKIYFIHDYFIQGPEDFKA